VRANALSGGEKRADVHAAVNNQSKTRRSAAPPGAQNRNFTPAFTCRNMPGWMPSGAREEM
jgi:hypothetical protein